MPLFLRKQFYFLLFILILPRYGFSQRVFVNPIRGINRSYLYYSNTIDNDRNVNKPVFIILHKNGNDARKTFTASAWNKMKEPAIFIFPNALDGNWKCDDSAALGSDAELFNIILKETYENFHHHRNRVTILTDENSSCIASYFDSKYPGVLQTEKGAFVTLEKDSSAVVGQLQNLLKTTPKTDTLYTLWTDPLARKPMDPLDSLRKYRLHNRIVLEVRTGGFAMIGSVKTGISDGTYTNLAKSHSFFDIHFTKWMNDSVAWFVDIGRLNVPRNEETTDSGIRTGGGSVMPITIGFKYALPKVKIHPYFLLGSGIIKLMVMGGKINTASAGSRPKMSGEMRTIFHTTVGTGMDMRVSKRIMLGFHLRYIHSANFESAGKVNAIRGFNLNAGLGYVINAKSTKKLPFPINPKK